MRTENRTQIPEHQTHTLLPRLDGHLLGLVYTGILWKNVPHITWRSMKGVSQQIKRTAWPVPVWSCIHTDKPHVCSESTALECQIHIGVSERWGRQGSQGQEDSRCTRPLHQENPLYLQPQASSPPAWPRRADRMAVVWGLPWDPQVLAFKWAGKYFLNYSGPHAILLHSSVDHPHSLGFLKVWGSRWQHLKINLGSVMKQPKKKCPSELNHPTLREFENKGKGYMFKEKPSKEGRNSVTDL